MQTDTFNIPDSDGQTYRLAVNEALQAATTSNASSGEPAETYPYMEWLDTSVTPAVLRRRNSGDTAWELSSKTTLTSALSLYVRTDGSDTNNGLTNTSGGALATLQKAVYIAQREFEASGYAVTVYIADGTYSGGVSIRGQIGGNISFVGNTSSPESVVIQATGANGFWLRNGVFVGIQGITINAPTSSYSSIKLEAGAAANITNVVFGSAGSMHIDCGVGCTAYFYGPYKITGGAVGHWHCGTAGSLILCNGNTITLTGTPAFSAYFAGVAEGTITASGNTFVGGATGQRYLAHKNGVIDVGISGSGSSLPGSVSGYTATGGQYVTVSRRVIGYWENDGSGGSVTQLTSKTTPVTLNKPSGQITMSGAELAGGGSVVFLVNCTEVTSKDSVVVSGSGSTSYNYTILCRAVDNGSFVVYVRNDTGYALSDAVIINYAVIHGTTT